MRVIHPAEADSPASRCLSMTALLAILFVTIVPLWGIASPVAAETEGGILEEVRKMLEAGMSEPIVLKWLDGSDEKPPRPSAGELISLKKAGASDELLDRLLELAGEDVRPAPAPAPETPVAESPAVAPAPARPAASRVPDARPVPTPAPTPVAPAPVAPTPAAPAPSVAPASGDASEIPVYFELTYSPDFDDDEDEWGLYVYINGEPLSYVPAGSLLSSRKLRFRHFMEPGSHVLRVAQERHEQGWGNRWFHAARMTELELPFQLTSGERADIELKFRQTKLAFGRTEGPISFRFVQGKNVEVIEKQGGDPDSWPVVCEEIEANAEDGKELKKSLRRELDNCQRWAAMWNGLEVPSRDEIREALALFDYRPIPKDQPLD